MNVETRIRPGKPSDYIALGELMYDAIHNGPSQYTRAQSLAWAPEPRRGAEWKTRLTPQHILVADREGGLIGFMSLAPGGYVDFAYIRPNAQGTGLFRRLFEGIEQQARRQGETALFTHASLMAQPAFAAMGFEIDHHETVQANGQSLARARMTKPL